MMVGNWLSVIIPHLYEVGITEKSKFRARRGAAATIMVGMLFRAIPHNSKCRYGERGAAAAGAVLKPQGGNCAVLP